MPFRKKETYEDVDNFGFACLLNGGRRIPQFAFSKLNVIGTEFSEFTPGHLLIVVGQ